MRDTGKAWGPVPLGIPVLAPRGAHGCLSVAAPSILCSFLLGNKWTLPFLPTLGPDWFLHRVHFLCGHWLTSMSTALSSQSVYIWSLGWEPGKV